MPWQCSPDTRAGDMIVFYMTSPDSKIDSVFRSISEGFNDPFFWYYRCCYISHFQKIKNDVFTIKFMKADPTFKNLPIVKKNMQGVNGTEIPAKNYNYIAKKSGLKNPILIKECGFEFNIESKMEIKNEHDVELKILEPLLEKLGWTKGDYVTQMVLKMGRNEKTIPDYVINPIFTPYHEKGDFVWKAKKDISNKKQLEDAKGQVVSYARRLCAKKCGVISSQDIWIMDNIDDYTDFIFESSIENLKNDDIFNKLKKIAGK